MWPFFWLKAAAVRIDDVWRLVVFSLSGQWSDDRAAVPIDKPYGDVAAISTRLDAASAWRMVQSMTKTSRLKLAKNIVATIPEIQVPPYVQRLESFSHVSDLI